MQVSVFGSLEDAKYSKATAEAALVAEVEDLERELKAYSDYAREDIRVVSPACVAACLCVYVSEHSHVLLAFYCFTAHAKSA